ncbi:MAG TPA: peptidyl-prolyl cis-trans isomerase [Stellaceae bacterium]|nr:peptidyl-prolyl cis-trans isomerase [Stellaceae bacterium]
MLQLIRSKASSLIVKILFGLLVISFGIWGIGDIFRNRGADTTVATVGDRKIDAQELNQEVRRDAERLRAMFRGAPLTTEQLKQFGVVDTALQRLINRNLIDMEVAHLRLAVGDDAVRQAIFGNPAFRNQNGAFDRTVYQQALANQRMSERQFESLLRVDMVRAHLNQALITGVTPAPELVDALYRTRAERRVADIVAVPETASGAPATPSDTDLAAFYQQHQDAFRVPELRSFTVGILSVDDVAAGIKEPEEKLREQYKTRAEDFHTPEQRHLMQILFTDEAKAKEAQTQLAAGKDFAQVAQEVTGETPDSLDLGFVKRDDLPPQLAEAAFALKVGETSAPVQSTLGWHILRLTEIKPEETQPFEAVKETLASDLAHEEAGDQIAKTANQIEDALAGGTSFAEIAQRFGLKSTKVENVEASGRGVDDKPVDVPQPQAEILRAAFATDAGQTSPLTEMGETGYFVVQTDKVTPTTVKPLEEVRARAIELLQADQRNAAQEKIAKELADEVNGGRSLTDAAAARKLTASTSAPLQHSGGDATVPPAVVAKIFQAKPGQAVFAKGNNGYVVAQLKEILPPDSGKSTDSEAQLAKQLTPAMQDDILQEFDKALRDRYSVRIDETAADRAF